MTKKEAKERGFTTCRFYKLAAFQEESPLYSATFHDGSMDFWEYIEGRLADVRMPRGRGGGAAVAVSVEALIKQKKKKKEGGGVVKLSITSPSGEQSLE